jgi:phage FluMu protein Com
MPNVDPIQIRCRGCHRRLADVVNNVVAGEILVEVKCPRCGQPHVEVIRSVRAIASSGGRAKKIP